MFIGLTSLSTYSFDHQRLSKKGGIKVLGGKATVGLLSLTVMVLFSVTHWRKVMFQFPSMCKWRHFRLYDQNMKWKYKENCPVFVVFINHNTFLSNTSFGSPLTNPLNMFISCKLFRTCCFGRVWPLKWILKDQRLYLLFSIISKWTPVPNCKTCL